MEIDLDLTPVPEQTSIQLLTPMRIDLNETKDQWFTPGNDLTPMVLRSQCRASHEKMAEIRAENEELKEQMESLKREMNAIKNENSCLKAQALIAEERLRQVCKELDNLKKDLSSKEVKPLLDSASHAAPIVETKKNCNRRSFIARPVPDFNKVTLPQVVKKKPTETKPFNVYNRPTKASINKATAHVHNSTVTK